MTGRRHCLWLLWLLCLLFSHPFMLLHAQPVSYTRQDSIRVVELLELGAKEMVNGKWANSQSVTLFFANQLMNRPYVGQTLEIKDKEEHLAAALGELPCDRVYYVEEIPYFKVRRMA